VAPHRLREIRRRHGMDDLIVETSLGKVRGHREGQAVAFRGIPYGESTGGRRRFLPPTPKASWAGILDASQFGPLAPQISDVSRIRTGPWLSDYRGIPADLCDEDCLKLNIWTPSLSATRLPVMVWLHGGGFTSGSAGVPVNTGDRLAPAGQVVVVSLNHRVGLLGHLHLAGLLGEDYASSGNSGLLDIILALKWVRENIGLFGGDPGRVMIFGVSGGGGKVASLMGMPSARGLFHAASMESGSLARVRTAEEAAAVTETVLSRLDIQRADLKRLLDHPWPDLLRAQDPLLAPGMWRRNEVRLGPVVDGTVLPVHPFSPEASPSASQVPALVGTTRDEMTVTLAGQEWFGSLSVEGLVDLTRVYFSDRAADVVQRYRSLHPEASPSALAVKLVADRYFFAAATIAARRAAAGASPTYLWRWDYASTTFGGALGAYHGMMDTFVFRNLDRSARIQPEDANESMMELAQRTWTTFAASGDPNHDSLPDWSPYNPADRPAMIFDHRTRVEPHFLAEVADLWGDVESPFD
jgi:para-nitrobenzyl esterase